jgi:hypothetical protein
MEHDVDGNAYAAHSRGDMVSGRRLDDADIANLGVVCQVGRAIRTMRSGPRRLDVNLHRIFDCFALREVFVAASLMSRTAANQRLAALVGHDDLVAQVPNAPRSTRSAWGGTGRFVSRSKVVVGMRENGEERHLG